MLPTTESTCAIWTNATIDYMIVWQVNKLLECEWLLVNEFLLSRAKWQTNWKSNKWIARITVPPAPARERGLEKSLTKTAMSMISCWVNQLDTIGKANSSEQWENPCSENKRRAPYWMLSVYYLVRTDVLIIQLSTTHTTSYYLYNGSCRTTTVCVHAVWTTEKKDPSIAYRLESCPRESLHYSRRPSPI